MNHTLTERDRGLNPSRRKRIFCVGVVLLGFSGGTATGLAAKDAERADAFLQEYAVEPVAALEKFFGTREALLDNPGVLDGIALKDKDASKTIQTIFRAMMLYGPFEQRKALVDFLGDWCSRNMEKGIGFLLPGMSAEIWVAGLSSQGIFPTYGRERLLDFLARYLEAPNAAGRQVVLVSLARAFMNADEYERYMPPLIAEIKKELAEMAAKCKYPEEIESQPCYWAFEHIVRTDERLRQEHAIASLNGKYRVTDKEYFAFVEMPFETQVEVTQRERKYWYAFRSQMCRHISDVAKVQECLAAFYQRKPAMLNLAHCATDDMGWLGEEMLMLIAREGSNSEARKSFDWFINHLFDAQRDSAEPLYPPEVYAQTLCQIWQEYQVLKNGSKVPFPMTLDTRVVEACTGFLRSPREGVRRASYDTFGAVAKQVPPMRDEILRTMELLLKDPEVRGWNHSYIENIQQEIRGYDANP